MYAPNRFIEVQTENIDTRAKGAVASNLMAFDNAVDNRLSERFTCLAMSRLPLAKSWANYSIA